MKFTAVFFALFATVSVAQMQQVPRVETRQDGVTKAKLNKPAMKNANGDIVPFDSKNVYMDQMNKINNGGGRRRKA